MCATYYASSIQGEIHSYVGEPCALRTNAHMRRLRAYESHDFDTATLVSALELATKYDNPNLRAYAIQQLNQHSLKPIGRFRLSRKYELTQWMSKAIDDLCWREEQLTVMEARILGPRMFVEVATRRETIKFERGSRVRFEMPPLICDTGTKAENVSVGPPALQELGNIFTAFNNILMASKDILATSTNVTSDLNSPAEDVNQQIPA